MPPEPETRIRVLIADDHQLFAQALMASLCADERIDVVGIARDGVEALDLADRLAPDVILMDVAMPRIDGLEATRRLRKRGTHTQVILVTAGDLALESIDVAAAGAAGVVMKSESLDQLLAAFFEIASIAVAFGGIGHGATTTR